MNKHKLALNGDSEQTTISLGFEFTLVFQPIVDVANHCIFGYEALVRGPNNESALSVLSQVNDTNRAKFDQSVSVKAIQLAHQLELKGLIGVNFFGDAADQPVAAIIAIIEAAKASNWPSHHILFELTQGERVDEAHLIQIFSEFKKINFKTAIDHFGAGYVSLRLLTQLKPDIIKLDMTLVRNIESEKEKQSTVMGILSMCKGLGISVIAKGVETSEEYLTLSYLGVSLFQGYLFAKPSFERSININDLV